MKLNDNNEQQRRRKWDRIDRTRNLFERGLSDEEMAEALGVHVVTIRIYRCLAGLKRNRKVAVPAPKITTKPAARMTIKQRKCLRCRTEFTSEGPWNHVCSLCKQSHAWQNGGNKREDGWV